MVKMKYLYHGVKYNSVEYFKLIRALLDYSHALPNNLKVTLIKKALK
tara:strand:- start:266 stop:406 length:141 start_codon:yes stop_codon:yes gene_type:complete